MRRCLALGCIVLAACTSALPPSEPTVAPTGSPAASATIAGATAVPRATAPPGIAVRPATPPPQPPTAAPTPGLDQRTAGLVADLDDACMLTRQPSHPFPLAPLVALADGRSAREFADVVGRSRCVLVASARGEGASELALISNYLDAAVFWVDRGWWRASVQPLMRPGVLDDRMVRGARELTIGICGCGSGGNIGVAVLRIDGSVLTRLLLARPGTSHVGASRLGDDLIQVSGRGGDGRPVAWTANCCMPGTHQWLYERRGATFALVAERQAYDPHYVAGLFFGGLQAGRAETLGDIASPEALAAAKTVFATRLEALPPSGNELYPPSGEELMRWTALPATYRRSTAADPLQMTFGLHVPTTGTVTVTQRARIEMRRRDTGWYVATFEAVP